MFLNDDKLKLTMPSLIINFLQSMILCYIKLFYFMHECSRLHGEPESLANLGLPINNDYSYVNFTIKAVTIICIRNILLIRDI